MMKFEYLTCCVHSTAQAIDDMTDRAREITLGTFRRACDFAMIEEEMGYARGPAPGLHIKDDYHVRYYRSKYRGRPCYYIVHSCIEYIFTGTRS